MSEISRATLFGKLNSLAYKAIEGATVFCKLRGNPYVELVHWIQQILQTTDSDLHRIVRHFELDPSRLAKDLTDALDRLPRGATSISDLSSHVESAVERGWVYASLMFGESQVRTGHLLVGIMKTPSLRNALVAMSRQFEGIKADALTEDFARIVAGSPEERLSAADRAGVVELHARRVGQPADDHLAADRARPGRALPPQRGVGGAASRRSRTDRALRLGPRHGARVHGHQLLGGLGLGGVDHVQRVLPRELGQGPIHPAPLGHAPHHAQEGVGVHVDEPGRDHEAAGIDDPLRSQRAGLGCRGNDHQAVAARLAELEGAHSLGGGAQLDLFAAARAAPAAPQDEAP